MRRSKSQLNAISRAYIKQNQKKANEYLEKMGIDFEEYKKRYGYKASVTRFATSIQYKEKTVMQNLENLKRN